MTRELGTAPAPEALAFEFMQGRDEFDVATDVNLVLRRDLVAFDGVVRVFQEDRVVPLRLRESGERPAYVRVVWAFVDVDDCRRRWHSFGRLSHSSLAIGL